MAAYSKLLSSNPVESAKMGQIPTFIHEIGDRPSEATAGRER